MTKAFLAASAATLIFSAAPCLAAPRCDPGNGGITLPKGFCALVAADDLGPARHAVAAPDGDLYVALRAQGGSSGGIVALGDSTGSGHFGVTQKFGSGSAT
ncbi:MAG: glucose dehydrogenase, partial [Rhizomicrobium sp.]